MWAKIILLAFMVMSLGYSLAKDGQPREGNHNFGKSFIIILIYVTLLLISWN